MNLLPGGVAVYKKQDRRPDTLKGEAHPQFGPETFSGKDWDISTKSPEGDFRIVVHFNPDETFIGTQFVGPSTVEVMGRNWKVDRKGIQGPTTLRLLGEIFSFQPFELNIDLLKPESDGQGRIVGRNSDLHEEKIILSLVGENSK